MSLDPSTHRTGLLVAIVKPSGAGKDTLLRHVVARLGSDPPVQLSQRVITRPADDASEVHRSLDENAFARAEAGEPSA